MVSKATYALVLIICVALTSCNYFQEKSLPHITTLEPSQTQKIEKIAILPFVNETADAAISDILRLAFFSNLSVKGYTVVRLEEIDNRLKMAESDIDLTNIELADPFKLGKILKVDALIFGNVTKCGKIFVGVYSNVAVGAAIKLVEIQTGKTIWAAEHIEKTHAGSAPTSPFSIPKGVVNSVLNLRDKTFIDTADRLAKKFIAGIPKNPFNAGLEAEIVSIKGSGDSRTVTYRVQSGDTLYKIAGKFYSKSSRWREIKEANQNLLETDLQTDSSIIIPNIPIVDDIGDLNLHESGVKKVVYKLKWGDSLYKLASVLYDNGKEWEKIYEANRFAINETTDLTVGRVIILPMFTDEESKP